MHDVWTLVVVALLYALVYGVGELGRKVASQSRWGWALIVLAPAMTAAAGWMVMVLWNLSVPSLFGLPQIELIPAIALGWLAGLLFRGISPRAVYDVDREVPA